VISCEKHPNADKLSITTVDVGGERLLPVVCGAPNVASGQKVVVATTGTVLYSDEASFEIKKTKIRGEVSEGMICAEDEIGLGTSHDGIMVLEENAVPGTPAKDYFDITEDHVFEIGLTPNRTDAMSHIGVARDILAALNLQHPERDPRSLFTPCINSFKVDNHDLPIDVIVEPVLLCIFRVIVPGVKSELVG
jgi:phenylalanyl-tRNA synthetase beta chain